ncbi:MAG: ZIP family metal transporter [Clostridia bacterium]
MNETVFFTLLGTLTGAVGTGLGGVISLCTKRKSSKFLSCILEFSAGLMLAVVFSDLLPNAFEKTNALITILGILIGILFMNITECITFNQKNSYLHIGTVLAIGIAMHNLPEGLAIGVSLDTDFTLGLSIAVAILLHDIPEGLALSIPLKMGGMKPLKILFIATATGLATGLGGLIGVILGKISDEIIGLSLGIASGAMIFIVICEIIPKSKQMYKGTLSAWFCLCGILVGILINSVL